MDNQNFPESTGDERWLDDTPQPRDPGAAFDFDEDADIFASLKPQQDDELDNLLAEIRANNWINDTIMQPTVVSEVREAANAAASEQTISDATMVIPIVPTADTPIMAADTSASDATMVIPSATNTPRQEVLPETEIIPEPAPVPTESFRDEEFRSAFGEGEELEQIFAPPATMEELTPAATPAEPEPPIPEEPEQSEKPKKKKKKAPEKRRPAHKKGYGLFGIPHILATFIWIGLAVIIGTSLGNVLWLMASDVLAFNQVPQTITITITEEDTLDTIAEQLQEKELIRYPWLFKLFAEFTGKAEDISPGSFTLNKPDEDGKTHGIVYDYNALLNSMRSYAAAREIVEGLMIPEGYTCKQIFELLERKGVCTVAELEEYAANGELPDYWFLEGVERGDKYCLEGYLFPDTYDFYMNDDPGNVLIKLLNAFDARFTTKMHESLIEINDIYTARLRSEGYSESYIAEHQIGIREVVIIASMIQKESASSDENYTISSVIYNRLVSDNFPYLQIDATVVYAWGGEIEEVLYEHMEIDDPHNTYMYQGLPIGPISNPGRDALYAAMSPSDTDEPYYYYVLNPETWKHEFFSSYDDFEDFLYSIGYYD